MKERKMSEVESFELITSMINDSRARMIKNLGTPFLIWGYVTVVVSLIQAAIIAYVQDFFPYLWGWFAIPVLGYLLMLLLNKPEKRVTNYIDRCVNALWRSIGVAALFLPFVCKLGVSIFPVVIILLGVGTVTTAAVVRDRVVKRIGFAAIFSSMLFPLVDFILVRQLTAAQFGGRERYLVECIIFAVIIFLLLVVSGHILNCKKRCLKN